MGAFDNKEEGDIHPGESELSLSQHAENAVKMIVFFSQNVKGFNDAMIGLINKVPGSEDVLLEVIKGGNTA